MAVGHVRGDAHVGHLIGGRYRIDSLVGRGGMANVYRATDDVLHRPVAVKLFGDVSDGERHAERASTEVRLLASLNHPSLVTLYDARVAPGDDAYLVMELVDGPTLHDRIADGPLDGVDIAAMALDLAEALHAVHDAGMVHRDIKPSNVLLAPSVSPTREFRAKLADFGIAHLVDSARLTTPGTIMGTAAYLSPEQTRGIAPAPAGDIYSLGLVLLESFTRTRAFPGGMTESLVARVQRDPAIPGDLGYAWKSLLTAMTSRSADARPTALDVAASAREILRSEGTGPLLPTATSSLETVSTVAVNAVPATTVNTMRLPGPTGIDLEPTEPVGRRAARQPDASRTAGRTLGMPAPRRIGRGGSTTRRPVDRRRSRRRLLLVASAVVVTIGLGAGLASWLTGGRAPVSATDTDSDGIGLLSTTMDEFSTGITSFVSERKNAAATASETDQSPDAVPATDTGSEDSGSEDSGSDDAGSGTVGETDEPTPDTSEPSGPDSGDAATPGGGEGADTDPKAPGNGNEKGSGNGNGKGNGQGPGNGKGPGG